MLRCTKLFKGRWINHEGINCASSCPSASQFLEGQHEESIKESNNDHVLMRKGLGKQNAILAAFQGREADVKCMFLTGLRFVSTPRICEDSFEREIKKSMANILQVFSN